MKNLLISFIGKGYVGKNYADDFEERGFNIIRYDIEKYKNNKNKIKKCDFVFIAVPTPTNKNGFDSNILESVLPLIGENKTAIIKSTIEIGTTRKLQNKNPKINLLHSPEFLTEKTAQKDAKNPQKNILGLLDLNNKKLYKKGEEILAILPNSPYNKILLAEEAELIKYGNNSFLYFKIIFFNILYDLAQKHNLNYENIKNAIIKDPRIGSSHTNIKDSGGRGAGGHCFLKDFEIFINMLKDLNLKHQIKTCEELRNLNLRYLKDSQKDLELLKDIYEK